MYPQASSPANPPAFRWLIVGSVCAVLLYVAALAVFSSIEFPHSMTSASHWPTLMDKPVGEDGYYMLTVADNIATKGQILYNRGLPATGIQPLATLLFAVLDLIVRLFGGGAAALIRSVMLLGIGLHVLLAWQLSGLAKGMASRAQRPYAGVLAFVLTLSSYTLFRLFTYGLETGIYLVVLAALLSVTQQICRKQHTSRVQMLALGVAAGLAGEARIDFGIVFAIILALLLYHRWISPLKAAGAGALAALIVSPWFWFVHHVTGSWLPTSGKAESTLITWSTVSIRIGTMLQAVLGELMPWCYAVISHVTVIVAACSSLAAAVVLTQSRDLRQRCTAVLLSRHGRLWLTAIVMLMAIYVVFFNSTHFYYRYAAPAAVLMLPACAVILSESSWVRRHTLLMCLALWTAFSVWSAASLHMGRISSSQTIAAGYVSEYFPAAHVGAFQSGVLGFFNRNVENLDGKLNQGALVASSRHQLPNFIDREHIDVLVDWPSVIHANLPSLYLQQQWMPCPIPMPGNGESICLVRRAEKANPKSPSQSAGIPSLPAPVRDPSTQQTHSQVPF